MNTTLIRHTLVLRQQHLLEKLTGIELGLCDAANDSHLEDMACQTLRELAQVKQVLHKLGSRGYGVCQSCGKAIEPARLRALPCTEYCNTCAVGH
jgi:RNA polymerase-binding transcription factor DksA